MARERLDMLGLGFQVVIGDRKRETTSFAFATCGKDLCERRVEIAFDVGKHQPD
jgi:hypothetical protein